MKGLRRAWRRLILFRKKIKIKIEKSKKKQNKTYLSWYIRGKEWVFGISSIRWGKSKARASRKGSRSRGSPCWHSRRMLWGAQSSRHPTHGLRNYQNGASHVSWLNEVHINIPSIWKLVCIIPPPRSTSGSIWGCLAFLVVFFLGEGVLGSLFLQVVGMIRGNRSRIIVDQEKDGQWSATRAHRNGCVTPCVTWLPLISTLPALPHHTPPASTYVNPTELVHSTASKAKADAISTLHTLGLCKGDIICVTKAIEACHPKLLS